MSDRHQHRCETPGCKNFFSCSSRDCGPWTCRQCDDDARHAEFDALETMALPQQRERHQSIRDEVERILEDADTALREFDELFPGETPTIKTAKGVH